MTVGGLCFAGRASASQVSAARVGELIVRNLDDYASIAEGVIDDPSFLRAHRERLRLPSTPLFDMKRYTEDFAAVVEAAWARLNT